MPDEPQHSSPAAGGDDSRYEAFVRLLVESEPRMLSYLRGLLPAWHDGEEVAQEASLVAWRKFAQFEAGTNFCGWLLTIARFEALKYRRKVARSPLVFSDEVWELLAATEAEPASIRREALEICLGKLPRAERNLVNRMRASTRWWAAVARARRRLPRGAARGIPGRSCARRASSLSSKTQARPGHPARRIADAGRDWLARPAAAAGCACQGCAR